MIKRTIKRLMTTAPTSRSRDGLNNEIKDVMTYLERVNKHGRDEHITFYEKTHTYKLNGQKIKTSCTEWIGTFLSKFDENKIIERLMKGKKYKTDPEYQYYLKTPKEIKDMWKTNREEASSAGTKMHATIETYMNSLACNKLSLMFNPRDKYTPEMLQFFSFMSHYIDHVIPWRTEMIVYDNDLQLAGSVDMIFKTNKPLPYDPNMMQPKWAEGIEDPPFDDNETRYYIFDWKRSKSIDFKDKYNPKSVIGVDGSTLSDCNYTKYSLQLNLYAYLLEKHYGIKIAGLMLAVFHPNQTSYATYRVPIIREEIETMLAKRRREIANL